MKNSMTIKPVTIPEKLDWLEHRYWRFGQDEALYGFLEDIFNVNEDGQITAQPRRDPLNGETKGLMVLGESGSGKTAMLRRMMRTSTILSEFTLGQQGNTLFVTVPPDASIKKLAEIILAKTGYQKVDSKLRGSDAWEMARHRFGLVGITTVIVDECHHMLQPGPGKDVRTAVQSLKHIMQADHSVALIIAGVPALKDAILSELSRESKRRLPDYHLSKVRPDTESARLFESSFAKSAAVLGIDVYEDDRFPDRILFAEHGQVGRSIALAKNVLREAVIHKRSALTLGPAEQVFKRLNSDFDLTPFHSAEWGIVKQELENNGWLQ